MSATTSLHPSLSSFSLNRFLKSPIVAIKEKHKMSIDENTFKTHFVERNHPSIITPFLNGLRVKFKLVDQLLLVCDTPNLTESLKELGFVPAEIHLSNIKWTSEVNSDNLPQGTNRLYHKDFNIEVYVQPIVSWSIVTTADIITKNLKVRGEQLGTFLSVYDSLYTLLETPKV